MKRKVPFVTEHRTKHAGLNESEAETFPTAVALPRTRKGLVFGFLKTFLQRRRKREQRVRRHSEFYCLITATELSENESYQLHQRKPCTITIRMMFLGQAGEVPGIKGYAHPRAQQARLKSTPNCPQQALKVQTLKQDKAHRVCPPRTHRSYSALFYKVAAAHPVRAKQWQKISQTPAVPITVKWYRSMQWVRARNATCSLRQGKAHPKASRHASIRHFLPSPALVQGRGGERIARISARSRIFLAQRGHKSRRFTGTINKQDPCWLSR